MSARVVAAIAVLGVVAMGIVTGQPALAAVGSPQSISADCDLANGVTATTITGQVGDTVIIDNTAGTADGCTFAATLGVVTASNLTLGVLASGATSTVTIISAGAFTITPRATAGGGTSATMTVVIGNPTPQPQYTITFDANGGSCSSNPLVITAASGDWYGLPTNGSGSFQCQRPGYQLIGWSHGSTLQQPGAGDQVPDLALPTSGASAAMAAAADHTTLFAVWMPLGVQVVYDANVGANDGCYVEGNRWSPSRPPQYRTSTEVLTFDNERMGWDALASSAPCTPITPAGAPFRLLGWALSGDGPVAHPLGQRLAATGFTPQSSVTLYAVWSGLTGCELPLSPGVDWSGCDLSGQNFTGANFAYVNLTGANLSYAILDMATMPGAILADANLLGASLEDTGLMYADLTGANLTDADLKWAVLGYANLLGANLEGADLQYANLGGATWTNGQICGPQSNGWCNPSQGM